MTDNPHVLGHVFLSITACGVCYLAVRAYLVNSVCAELVTGSWLVTR